MRMLLAAASALMFASCVPSTPQTRIQQNPEKFAALSPRTKSCVERGEIVRGMSPDAVYLAWGAPSRTFQGSQNGKATERWDYAGTQPVYSTNFYGTYGYAYGRGPYGYHGRYGYSGFGLAPEVAYVPYRVASVWFIDNRVDAWERVR